MLVALGRGPAGTQRLTLDLHPAELGRVQIHLDRSKAGEATVHIIAERPETLQLLRHDQQQLHRALDQAGLPAAGRQVFLDMADPQSMPRRQEFNAAGNGSNNGNGNESGSNGQRDRGTGGSDGGTGRQRSSAPPAWARAGVDITA